jgi:ATP-dependent DNA ligase
MTLTNLKNQVKNILDEAKRLTGLEYVLDGECCLLAENGKDDFSGIMKQITRKDHTISNPRYVLFDIIKKSEFESTIGATPFSERIALLEKINIEEFGYLVKLVEHSNFINEKVLEE